jgi:rubrerythrin
MFRDPQDYVGHYCPICGRETFGEEDELCPKCKDRMTDDEDYE